MNPQTTRLIVFLSGFFLMSLVETFVSCPQRKWTEPRWKRFSFHGGLALFNSVGMRILIAPPFFLLLTWVEEHSWGLSHVLGLSQNMEVGLGLLFFDGYDYWLHRFHHLNRFLWRFHLVHHADTHIDVTTSLRFHLGEFITASGFKAVWVVLWGPSFWGYALCEMGISLFSQFHHSNITFTGRTEALLRLIHITPRLHTSHHTVSKRSRDANYSTIFSVWDRIFGTFVEPDDQEMKRLGVAKWNTHTLSFWELLKAPFK